VLSDEKLLRVPDADDIAVVANMYVPGTDGITVVATYLMLMTSLLSLGSWC
jgi:hypothetical protein